ncbi:MAG: flippase [Bacteroidetes bacterium]|nr:flippase [Bacteroidota bacterium]
MKKYLNIGVNKRLLENFFSLSILQIANYIIPLITLPYLVRVLLPSNYGLLAFAQALIQYFNVFIDYGFNFSATREISIYRQNKEKVSAIFSSVMTLKILFVFISLSILSLIIFSFDKLRSEWLLYYCTFGIVIGQNMFPRWFFQGIEQMKYITILNLISRIIFTISIFVVVKSSNDYLYVPIINSLGFILAGILSLWVAFYTFKIRFIIPTFADLKYQLVEGWHLFISTLATSLYTTSNVFILGLFADSIIVGYYSAAERIIKAIEDFLSPIFYSVYPYLSRLYTESKQDAIKFIRKLVKYVGFIGVIITVMVLSFTNLIVKILLGSHYLEAIVVLKILAFIPLVGGINIITTSLTMLSFNYKKAFSNIIIFAGIFNLGLSFLLVPYYKHIGSSISVLLSEVFIMLITFIYLKRKNINLI